MKRDALRRYADAMAQRVASPNEDPEVWATIREAIADHLDAYLQGQVERVEPEVALLLASSLRQPQHKELPELWTPMPKRQGESPDTSGVHACRATAVEYILFCRAHKRFDGAPAQTVAAAFACSYRTVLRFPGQDGPTPPTPEGMTPAQEFDLRRAGMLNAARHFIKFGGASNAAISARRSKE